MRGVTFFSATLAVSLGCLPLVSANAHSPADASLKRHHRAGSPHLATTDQTSQNLTVREDSAVTLNKRFDNARFSLFDTGLGSCGKTNSRDDFIVALNIPQYDNGAHCFEMVTISYGGKTTQAQIVDRCKECPYGALDFSRGLFDFFGSEAAGYLWGTWNFGTGSDPAPTTTTTQAPQPTSTKPTSTWTPPPSTTSSVQKKTSTLTSQSTSSSSVISSSSVAPSTTNIAPAVAATSAPAGMLDQFNLAMVQLAGLVVSGAQTAGK